MRLTKLLRCFLGIFLAIVTVAVLSSTALGQRAGATTVMLFEGARLINGEGGAPIENSAFLVDNGKFTRVGRKGDVQLPAGATRIDLTGKTVIPAMIELHTHSGWANLRSGSAGPETFTRENLVDHMQRHAYYGFAVVTSLGYDPGDLPFQVRGEQIPNAALFRTAGRGVAMPNGVPPARKDVPYLVTTEAEVRQAVQDLAPKRPDMIKIWIDDRGGTVQKMPPNLYRAVIDEAHKHNLRVVAHIFNLADAKDLLLSGVDGFAHGVRDVDIDDEFVTLMRKRPNVFVGPNLPPRGVDTDLSFLSDTLRPEEITRMRDAAAKQTPEDRQKARDFYGIQARNLAKLNKAGVLIGLGTDGNGAGWQGHVEIEDMVAAGMTPAQAIVAATRNSARILRLEQLGTVASGRSADFVVLNANPLDDITNTRRVAMVYLRGQEVDRAALRTAWTGKASQ